MHERPMNLRKPTRHARASSLLLAFVALFAVASAAAAQGRVNPARPPNILLVLIDDLGARDLPIYGNEFHETPNIDRLAAQGMVFTDAYAAAPVCTPARVAIQSGQYPARVGVTELLPGFWRPFEKVTVPINRTQYLPAEVVTVGEALKSQGYTTGYFGKWHLGEERFGPAAQGYDSVLLHRGAGHSGKNVFPRDGVDSTAYLTEVLTDRSIRFMKANRDRPFFLTLSHFAVHTPLQAKRELIDKYQRKPKPKTGINNPIYAAMVEHVDDSIGELMRALDELGLAENTVVVFFSDNGGLTERWDKDGTIITTNAPLRSEKGSLYEGGIRVPLIVRWPGVVKPSSATDTPVSGVDFYPTFLQVARAAPPAGKLLDGLSLVPLLEGRSLAVDRTIFFHYPHYHHDVPASAVRQGPYKLMEFHDEPRVALYNLELDPGEQRDLSRTLPGKTQELREMLSRWRLAVGADLPVPNPRFDMARRNEFGPHPNRPAGGGGEQ